VRGRRLDPLVLIRGLPGHPLHPPLTDATIGMFVLAGGLAIVGYAGGAQDATAKPPAMAGGAEGVPAEQHFPVPIVALHGVLAATTLVLVLLTALDVGGS
jgi:hypothetical protein